MTSRPCRMAFLFLGLTTIAEISTHGQTPKENVILFRENFDDGGLLQRGWYDGGKIDISADRPFAGSGCVAFHWSSATSVPSTATLRHLFEPTDTVYTRFHMRLSKGWKWTGRNYHPHMMQFMTTENSKFHGPAASHLTLYIEPQEGRLRLAAQDIENKDQPHGLTQGPLRGGYNGMLYDSQEALFVDDEWHLVEAMFRLNTVDVEAKKTNSDGTVRGWFDGQLVVDRNDVILRSVDFPKMKLNQFLLAPYFGPGLLRQAQTLWIDELTIATERPK